MDSFLSSIAEQHRVRTLDQLLALYGQPVEAALVKEIEYVSDHYRCFIEKSPFVIVATSGKGGLDCSPRGDPAGFVRVHDSKTVLLPDRRGNNRLDSLRNLIEDPRISLLFLLPGVGTTMRINGQATLVTDPDLRQSFEMNGKIPATVIVVSVERIYTQCPKALIRSDLWNPDMFLERSNLPSSGTMAQALNEQFDGKAYDEGYTEHVKKTLY